MRLMLKSEKALDKWFTENGWEKKTTKFGSGWSKEGWRPFLKNFFFYSDKILDTEDEEDYEEREDEEGRKILYFNSVNKHFYPEWLEGAMAKKLDAILEEDPNAGKSLW